MSSPNYTYSYSGADCDAFAFFPGSEAFNEYLAKEYGVAQIDSFTEAVKKEAGRIKGVEDLLSIKNPFSSKTTVDQKDYQIDKNFSSPIKLNSMATISISIHEAKSPVRRLGERGVSGYTRGIRTIAGTIVFVIVEDHPLRMLAVKDPANIYKDLIGWSRDSGYKGVGSTKEGKVNFDNKISTLISPMNIMLRYQTEVARNTNTKEHGWLPDPGASMMLEGVEFVNEGIVTSVNDMVTEVVCQFVAQDIRPFTDHNTSSNQEIIDAYNQNQVKDKYKGYYNQLEQTAKSKGASNEDFGNINVNISGYQQ
ncbi:hypothetical protein CMI37_34015 [Candidatus Pacearchaeota archaeon]|nr:hypothetical protein [Candidatus Pacearchaeota archaeon]